MGVLEGAKWVSWVHRFQTKHFLADSGQISGQIGHISNYKYGSIRLEIWPESAIKCFVWNLWTQETHFAPSSTPITHFATILESFEDLENFKILLHFTILGISVDVDMA